MIRVSHRALSLLILIAGLWAYHNSFRGTFLFDDHRHIIHHAGIRSLASAVTQTPRPVVDATFAVNYVLGGLRVSGYHAVNLAIHLFAGLLLFGVVRRTLLRPGRGDEAASGIACAIALLWVVHPLQTESVTYIVQRAESLAGLCYLLTLYAVIRSAAARTQAAAWRALAIGACAVGMGCKPVMVTAPLAVLAYDRLFLAGSFRAALRERANLYLGLAATWGLLAGFVVTGFRLEQAAGGYIARGSTPLAYALTQPGVITHYLKLALWPHPLVFDYLWPIASRPGEIIVPLLLILALGWLTVLAWRRHLSLAYLGVWFFLTLAPSSSFIPIPDAAAEHRMYLPLAAVIALLVGAADAGLRRMLAARPQWRRSLACGLLASAVAVLSAVTINRNAVYASEEAMWRDVLDKRPGHFRAHSSLGDVLRRQGRLEEALAHLREAVLVMPAHPETHFNLGAAYLRAGQLDAAIGEYRQAVQLRPDYPEAHNHLGIALRHRGATEQAIQEYREAIRLMPGYVDAHYNLANALVVLGGPDHTQEAIAEYEKALDLQPDYADYIEAHEALAGLLAQRGDVDEAARHEATARRLQQLRAQGAP